jgi:hypothetical protein
MREEGAIEPKLLPVCPVESTLTDQPIGVDSKALASKLSPLAATLTKKGGGHLRHSPGIRPELTFTLARIFK